jgi:hypothetical protein
MIRSNRIRRQVVKSRATATHAARRIARRGTGTLAAHCLAVGLTHRQAASVAGTLRKKTEEAGVAGVVGRAFRKGTKRPCTRYTRADVRQLVALYRPRRDLYKQAAARLSLAA